MALYGSARVATAEHDCTLQALLQPRAVHRTDRGTLRVLPQAALTLRTTNQQGRHRATPRAIEIRAP